MADQEKKPGQKVAEDILKKTGERVLTNLESDTSTTPKTVQEELAQRDRAKHRLAVLTFLSNLANGIRTFFQKK